MATNQTFADFFAGQRMTLLSESATIKGGVPRVLPANLYEAGPTKPFNDKVQWPAVKWNRAGSTVIERGSPPRAIKVGDSEWRFATILNMAEEMAIDFHFLQALASDFAPVKQNALAELNRQMIMFNQRFETTRTNMVQSAFANGAIWIGSDGQILASSSGAAITMSCNVPTANQLTKDGAGSTYNIGDWSSAATDIQGKLRGLQNYCAQQTGFVLKNVIYGTSLPTYLSQNTALSPYLSRNAVFRDYLVGENEVPNGFLGMSWTPARLAYSVNAAGTITATFPDNFLGFYPDVSPEWYEMIEGGTQVPVGIASGAEVRPNMTVSEMANAFMIKNGRYGYGVIKNYPTVGQSYVQGDCAGPVFKNPNVYFYGTCS